MAVDWIRIKNEYICTGISRKALAAKYGVSFNRLAGRAKQEGWFGLKKQLRAEAKRGADCGEVSAGVEAERGTDCREESAGAEAEHGTDCREESAGVEAKRGTDCREESAGVEAKCGAGCKEESAGVEAERGVGCGAASAGVEAERGVGCREESAGAEAERGVGCGEKINRLADKLCDKAGFAIDSLGDENVDPQKLRQLVQSVKDLKEIVKYDGTAEDVGRLEELIKGLSEL